MTTGRTDPDLLAERFGPLDQVCEEWWRDPITPVPQPGPAHWRDDLQLRARRSVLHHGLCSAADRASQNRKEP